MSTKDISAAAFKLGWILCWVVIATYYFRWGDNENSVTDPIDETGWVPDRALAACVTDTGNNRERN